MTHFLHFVTWHICAISCRNLLPRFSYQNLPKNVPNLGQIRSDHDLKENGTDLIALTRSFSNFFLLWAGRMHFPIKERHDSNSLLEFSTSRISGTVSFSCSATTWVAACAYLRYATFWSLVKKINVNLIHSMCSECSCTFRHVSHYF